MPIEVAWQPREGIWKFTVGDTFSLTEVVDVAKRDDLPEAGLFLWDLRHLRRGPDTSDELRDAADSVAKGNHVWNESRTAVLVKRDLDFGIARMFQVYADGIGMSYEIFRDEAAAIEWLTAPTTAP